MSRRALLAVLAGLSLLAPVALGAVSGDDNATATYAEPETNQTPEENVTIELADVLSEDQLERLEDLEAPTVLLDAPPGLGADDPWVDANGDQMFGALEMGPNVVRLNGRGLSATVDGDLQFEGDSVCLQQAANCEGQSVSGTVPIEVQGSNVQLSTQGCAQGEFWKWTGSTWDCLPDDDTTYDGSDFALSDQSCDTGDVVAGLDASGNVACVEDATATSVGWDSVTDKPAGFADDVDNDTTYDGSDFALSDQACPDGDVVAGVSLDGQLVCQTPSDDTLASLNCASDEIVRWDGSSWTCSTDQDTTYDGSDFALSDQACASGEVVAGVDASGNVACVVDQDTDSDTLSELNCASSEITRYDGSTWTCSTDKDTTYTAGDGLVLDGTTFNLVQACASGELLKWDGSSWTCGPDQDTTYDGSDFALSDQSCSSGDVVTGVDASGNVVCGADATVDAWLLGGNTGTDETTDFIGTTDETNLTVKVNGTQAAAYVPTAGTPNVVSGNASNVVTADAQGAVIGGGGDHVASRPGTVVGGGVGNTASGTEATVAGGDGNTASDSDATVGGGAINTASGVSATVAGGEQNTASSAFAVVAGGNSNTASAFEATVAGGQDNEATGLQSSVGGGSGNTAKLDTGTTVAGGVDNRAGRDHVEICLNNKDDNGDGIVDERPCSPRASDATVGGGDANIASGPQSTVAGGANNIAKWETGTTVAGGVDNRAGREHMEICSNGLDDDLDADTDESECSPRSLYATVGGGTLNNASGQAATIGGGEQNWVNAPHATISGGLYNNATDDHATVAGGLRNDAMGYASAIAGGSENQAGSDTVASNYDFVGGGRYNTADGGASTVGGGFANTVTGNTGTVAGGQDNTVRGDESTIGGGSHNWIGADFATIAGGGYTSSSQADADQTNNTVFDDYGTLGGGGNNTVGVADRLDAQDFAAIGGGQDNYATSRGGAIGGGSNNTAGPSPIGDPTVPEAEVCNGIDDDLDGQVDEGLCNFAGHATVAGGKDNKASDELATVGGGVSNTASGAYAAIAGGSDNTASGDNATVGGGDRNTASALYATVGGGTDNTADGARATVGGGDSNTASGTKATVPGGDDNEASGFGSFAAGTGATAQHHGTFVWSDSTNPTPDAFTSTDLDQFLIEAAGGVGIGTNSPSAALDVDGNVSIGTGNLVTPSSTPLKLQPNNASDFDDVVFGDGHSQVPDVDVEIGAGGLCVDDDGDCLPPADGEVTANAYNTGSSDLAEVYPSEDDLEPAEVVTLDPENPGHFQRTTEAGQQGPLHVVSTEPGLLLGAPDAEELTRAGVDAEEGPTFGETTVLPDTYPVALSGRVPVQAIADAGAIEVGDPLTSSPVPGTAQKAQPGQPVLGHALEPLDAGTGTIEAFVGVGADRPADASGNEVHDATLAELEDQLAAKDERIDQLAEENDELRDRLEAIEERLDDMEDE